MVILIYGISFDMVGILCIFVVVYRCAVEVYTKHCQLQRPCGHMKVFTQTLLRQVITSRMIEKLIVIWWPQRFIVRNKSIEICLRLFQWIPSHWSWMVPCSETQYCSYSQVRKFVAVEEEQNSKDFAYIKRNFISGFACLRFLKIYILKRILLISTHISLVYPLPIKH